MDPELNREKTAAPTAHLQLLLRRRRLVQDAGGHNEWQIVSVEKQAPAAQTAIIVCDMWDRHWSQGAAGRVDQMAPRMNGALKAARARGVLIIHAPSDTMRFYAGAPARERIRALATVAPPADAQHADPPLPIDDSDGGSDTGETQPSVVWTRQHPAIEIDQARDLITDNGREVYSALRHAGIRQVLICGVHTNMCVLGRSFAIKQMVRWGIDTALIRDLTDALYNPAMRPYVSQAEGTRLVVEFVEKFWCPTIGSGQLMG